jgi:hypothetical protein
MENTQELETPKRGRPPKEEKMGSVETESTTENTDVSALKQALENQQKQIEQLTVMLSNKPRDLKKPTEHVSHILLWQDTETGKTFAVTGVKHITHKKDEQGDIRLFADFELNDGVTTEKRKLDYLNTLTEGFRNKVKIVSVKKNEITRNQGNSPTPILHTIQCSDPVSLKKNNQQFSERQIELIETKFETETVIEFIEGQFTGRQMTLITKAGEDNCLNY